MAGKLIALGGYKRAGKDAAGDYLEEKYGFVKLGMSDPLNEALQKVGPEGPWVKLDFDIYDHTPWKHGLRRGKYAKNEIIRYNVLLAAVGYTEAKRHKDVREYLQGLGTEVGREMIHPDVWIDMAEERIANLLRQGTDVVITAIRFPNELDRVHALGGADVWIERSAELRGADEDGHKSENSLSDQYFSLFLENNGTLEELHEKLDTLVTSHPSKRVPELVKLAIADDEHGWPQYDH